jgi:hypothetical protein
MNYLVATEKQQEGNVAVLLKSVQEDLLKNAAVASLNCHMGMSG